MTALAQLVVAAAFSVSGPYGLEDLDLCATPTGSTFGTVESVREVPVMRDIHAFDAEVLEHKVAPETAEELAVRLDAGPLVIFTEKQSHGLRAGQRVVVRLSGSDSLVRSETCPVLGWRAE